MTAMPNPRSKEIVNRIRLYAFWMASCSVWFGFDLGDAVWKRHGAFYPFLLLSSGLLTVLWSFLTVGTLNQLSSAVKAEEAQTMKSAARRLAELILGSALIGLLFAVCTLAAELFGWHYVVMAIALGTFEIALIFAAERELRRLPCRFSHLPADETRHPAGLAKS